MAYFHKNLSSDQWNGLSKDKQILNIVSELLRARNRLAHHELEYFTFSLNRALELTDLSINDKEKWRGGSLRELLRFREHCGSFYQENRSLDEFIRLARNLLLFHSKSSLVKI